MNKADLIAKYGESNVELYSEIPEVFSSRQAVIEYIKRQVAQCKDAIERWQGNEYKMDRFPKRVDRDEFVQDGQEALAEWERELEINTVILQEETEQ